MPPTDDASITVRSQSKHSNAIRHSASPSTPSTDDAGTRQSVSTISEVGDERQPSLSSSRPTEKPGVFVSTTNAVAAERVEPSGPPVLASTVQTSAMGPLVMKILLPLSTHSSPSRTAVVFSAAASDPASGSVDAQHPMKLPSHNPGSQRCLSSSDPCSAIGRDPITQWAPSDSVRPPSRPPAPMASLARQASMIDAPPPPYCSGISNPASPWAASDFQTAGSQVPVWSRSAAPGATTSAAQRATLSRKACCSGVIVKSMEQLLAGRPRCGARY